MKLTKIYESSKYYDKYFTAIGQDKVGNEVTFGPVTNLEGIAKLYQEYNNKHANTIELNDLNIYNHEEDKTPEWGYDVDIEDLEKILEKSKFKYGTNKKQKKLNFPESVSKQKNLLENYERFFGKIKPLKTESAFVMTPEDKKRFNNISTSMARKYPNAAITLKEGFVYLGYKKLEPIQDFLKRSSLNINETIRAFSVSGKKGLL